MLRKNHATLEGINLNKKRCMNPVDSSGVSFITARCKHLFDSIAGWEPLCKFLNKPIPDEPFPNVNDKEQIKADMTKVLPLQICHRIGDSFYCFSYLLSFIFF